MAIDVVVASSLPGTVVNDQLLVISSQQPTKITFDTVEPTSRVTNDIWVEMAAGSTAINLEDGKIYLNVRPRLVRKFSGTYFDPVNAYLGVSGSWVQVSSSVTQMGVSYDTALSSPNLTRLGASVGKTATAGVGTVAQVSDFDSMPIYRDIKLCNLAANGTVNAYLGGGGFSRTGSNGDVMVEIPAFYYKIVSGAVEQWWIADGPAEGFVKHPAFARGVPYADLAKIYVSAYETASGYTSKTGVAALVSITRAAARSGSAGKGSRWSQMDVAATMAVNLLMYIEYATLNMQAAIGPGVSAASKINTGGSDSMAGHTGRAAGTADAVAVKWRHIENWWGNVWTWVDGININGGAYYWCLLPSNFADDTTNNYTSAGYTVPTSLSSSYIKTVGLNTSHPWFRMPLAAGGSETTYYCDAAWTNTGWRVADFGGGYDIGAICGPACWYLNYGSTSASASIGCRLLYLP